MELNDLRKKNICFRKSEVSVERILVCNVNEKLEEHGINCLPSPILMTSVIFYCSNSDVILTSSDDIRMSFCQETKHNSWLLPSCYGNRSIIGIGASQTEYAMLHQL